MPAPLTLNTSDYAIRQAREELLGWAGALDAKRPRAWDQYGYPETVGFIQLRGAYERGGAGHGAVHKLLGRCWQQRPRFKSPASDKEGAWEKKVGKLMRAIKGWQKLRDFDRRNLVGRFAGLIYRVADGQPLSAPLAKAQKLVDVVPVYEDQLKVTRWQEDKSAEDYGQPLMWQFRTREFAAGVDSQGKPGDWLDVHPSRVQILAEGAVSDFLEGVPLLLAGYNALIDIEKLSGGGAESALKNSARTVVFEYKPEAAVQALTTQNPDGSTSEKSVREVHAEQTREMNRNLDSSIVIQGGAANTLQTQVANLGPQFEIAASLFAASVQIPLTVLMGQQTGRLASDEDQADFNERCNARRDNELTPMLEEFITRMQACGVIDAGEFEIEWPALGAPTEGEQLDNLGKLTAAMQQYFQAGGTDVLFDGDELRKAAGYEQRPLDALERPELQEGGDPAADDKPKQKAP